MNYDKAKNEQLKELQNDEVIIRSLHTFLQSSHPGTTVLNIKRYQEMMFAKAALDDLLQQNGTTITAAISVHPVFCAASLWIELDDFEVCDKTAFYLAMQPADNFEVTPLTNGKLRLAFMFYRMFVPTQYKEETNESIL